MKRFFSLLIRSINEYLLVWLISHEECEVAHIYASIYVDNTMIDLYSEGKRKEQGAWSPQIPLFITNSTRKGQTTTKVWDAKPLSWLLASQEMEVGLPGKNSISLRAAISLG